MRDEPQRNSSTSNLKFFSDLLVTSGLVDSPVNMTNIQIRIKEHEIYSEKETLQTYMKY